MPRLFDNPYMIKKRCFGSVLETLLIQYLRLPCKNEEKILERLGRATVGAMNNSMNISATAAIGTLF
jgi:hypothetical protein